MTKIHERFYEISNKIKAAERRLETLTEHFAQIENFQQNRAIYQKYQSLEMKKRDTFYDKHSEEIKLYEVAKSYLDKVMNGRMTLPIKAWKVAVCQGSSFKFYIFYTNAVYKKVRLRLSILFPS